MAQTKSTAAARRSAAKQTTKVNATTADAVVEVVEENIPEVTPVVKEEKTKKVFNQEDVITCRSTTVGGLWLEGDKSKTVYNWLGYGDEVEVEYRDLVSLVRRRSTFIYSPLFIILDEDFVDSMPDLRKFYDQNYNVMDLKKILYMSAGDMVEAIKALPESALNSLKSIASTQIANGELDSMRKIKALDEIFGTSLNLMATFDE